MSNIICVTNRKLCREDFLLRIEKIASAGPAGIILREKDLSYDEYKILAETVIKICKRYGVKCILHSFVELAIELEADSIHLPMPILRNITDKQKAAFKEIGASCHSADEAKEALKLGCSYIIAGHIFDTDCKKGLLGRGLSFLKTVCDSVDIPVYAIGGINSRNIDMVKAQGAYGACIMSSLMTTENVAEFLRSMEDGR